MKGEPDRAAVITGELVVYRGLDCADQAADQAADLHADLPADLPADLAADL